MRDRLEKGGGGKVGKRRGLGVRPQEAIYEMIFWGLIGRDVCVADEDRIYLLRVEIGIERDHL